MLRWIVVLMVACLLTGLLGLGIIPTVAAGLARTLFTIFASLLVVSLVGGIIRGV